MRDAVLDCGGDGSRNGKKKLGTCYDTQTTERDELYRQSKLNAVPSSSSFV